MIINVSYDSSVLNLDPTTKANYEAAVTAAVSYYEKTIANPITVNFGYGEVGGNPMASGAVGNSESYGEYFSYLQIYKALAASDTVSAAQTTAVASLPSTDPTNGAQFAVNTAEAQALGLTTPSSSSDGAIGLSRAYS